MSKQTGESKDGSPQRQRVGAAAADELRAVVRAELAGLFNGFMQQALAALKQAASDRAQGAVAQQLAQTLAGTANSWSKTFLKHVDDQLVGGLSGGRPEAARPQGDGEDVAAAGMELRAEARYQAQIAELDEQLNQVRLTLYVPIYARALAPAGLFRSLHDTAEALGWPAAQRLLLFKLFDAHLIAQLDGLYRNLQEALKPIGATMEKAAAESPPEEEISPVTTPIKRRRRDTPPDALIGKVDNATLSMLKACSLNTQGEGYNDGSLAADLLELADKRPLPGMTVEQCDAPLQRMELAGKFFNQVIDGPLVPEAMRPDHEAIRLPLIKSALADPTLFTEASHPLRSLVNEVMLKSAFARISDTPESRRLADLLKEVLENFNLAPEFVREAMKTAEPIQKGQIQRFFEQQRYQAEESRQAVISEAKRLVGRELQRLSIGPNVPEPAIRFLDKAWGPVATQQLLRYGAADEHWKSTLQLMEKVMSALETREPDEPPSPEWKELMRGVADSMVAEGMSKAAIKEALSGLEAARNTVA